MTRESGALAPATANAVFDVLVEHAGANEHLREEFVHHQTRRYMREFRFIGSLGFGGKFRRGTNRHADGTFGESWYIDTYPEDMTPAREQAIATANPLLDSLREQAEQASASEDIES